MKTASISRLTGVIEDKMALESTLTFRAASGIASGMIIARTIKASQTDILRKVVTAAVIVDSEKKASTTVKKDVIFATNQTAGLQSIFKRRETSHLQRPVKRNISQVYNLLRNDFSIS
jgi:hypothetical protein